MDDLNLENLICDIKQSHRSDEVERSFYETLSKHTEYLWETFIILSMLFDVKVTDSTIIPDAICQLANKIISS